ncbi:hypothetical protein BGZ51_000332 [Haplosporangium sp. Z 767]|nr:hypothetical protein BGZ50_000385 [Haplosporangium sp. Z 11]KAF9176562.1 hypothetical protein BGZ51_000332 [Haplosporangium sp. Z 767]
MSVLTDQHHLKRKQCDDAEEIPRPVVKKHRILVALPRRRPGMSMAAGVRAAVEARAVARMTSVVVMIITLVGTTTLCPPPTSAYPAMWTSTHAVASVSARPTKCRQVAMCRRKHPLEDVEVKDVSASLPLPMTVFPLPTSVPVPVPAVTCAQYQKASKDLLTVRRIAVLRKKKVNKEDDVEDIEVDG